MAFDPSLDFAAVVDGPETVSVTIRATGVTTTGVFALRQVASHGPIQVGGITAMSVKMANFLLDINDLDSMPGPGDRITDAGGVSWTIGDTGVTGATSARPFLRCKNCRQEA